MSELIGQALMRCPRDGILWRSGHDYYVLGKKVFRLCGGSISQPPALRIVDAQLWEILQRSPSRLPAALRRPYEAQLERLHTANMRRLVSLEEEAVTFLRTTREAFPDLPLVVSWSGGKDSTVASMLAQRAFPNERIIHVFADTTIELPSTYEYLTVFRKAHPTVPFLIGLPARNFYHLCDEIGPPSVFHRWCCDTHKAFPLFVTLNSISQDKSIVVVTGLRKAESMRREKYEYISWGKKIGFQCRLSPLLPWTDFDIWCWIIINRVKINDAYKVGLDRVGCGFCPAGANGINELIINRTFPTYWQKWIEFLQSYFTRNGVENASEYVRAKKWQSRKSAVIGNILLSGHENYIIDVSPCQYDNVTITYNFSKEFDLESIKELLKVFGNVIRRDIADQAADFEVEGPFGKFIARAMPIWERIRVTFCDIKTKNALVSTLKKQLRKIQTCVRCGACVATCPTRAIRFEEERYIIDEGKCQHCLFCIKSIERGCRAAASINVTGKQAYARGN